MNMTLILIISIICLLLCFCALLLSYWFKLINRRDEENKEKLNAIVAIIGLFFGSAGAIGLVISIIGFIPTNSNNNNLETTISISDITTVPDSNSTIDTSTQESKTENSSTFISHDDKEKELTTTYPISEFSTYTTTISTTEQHTTTPFIPETIPIFSDTLPQTSSPQSIQSFKNEIYADQSNVFLNVGDEAIITVTVLGSHRGITVGTTDKRVAAASFSPARWNGNNITVKITAKGEGTASIKVYLKGYSDTVYTYIDVTVLDTNEHILTENNQDDITEDDKFWRYIFPDAFS